MQGGLYNARDAAIKTMHAAEGAQERENLSSLKVPGKTLQWGK